MPLSTNRPVFKEIISTTSLGLIWNQQLISRRWRRTPHRCKHKLHSEYKTKDASHYSINIWNSRTAFSSCHCIQQLWQENLQWNEIISTHLHQKCNQKLQCIPKLIQLEVNRKVICSNAVKIQLNGFCDSSDGDYWACLYMLSTESNNPCTNFEAIPHYRRGLCWSNITQIVTTT